MNFMEELTLIALLISDKPRNILDIISCIFMSKSNKITFISKQCQTIVVDRNCLLYRADDRERDQHTKTQLFKLSTRSITVFLKFCGLPCKCLLLSYTSLTLAKLLHPKIQELFDPFFHTLPPLSLLGCHKKSGESRKGVGVVSERVLLVHVSQKRKIRDCSLPNNANMKREKGEQMFLFVARIVVKGHAL